MKCGAADGSYHRIFRSLLMSSDLLVPLLGGGALLQIHGLQDGILPKLLLYTQDSFLTSAFLLSFFQVSSLYITKPTKIA